jgi:hypothetical protein
MFFQIINNRPIPTPTYNAGNPGVMSIEDTAAASGWSVGALTGLYHLMVELVSLPPRKCRRRIKSVGKSMLCV